MICSQCHTENEDGAAVCMMCGNDLSPMTVTLVGQNGASGISVAIPPEGCRIGRQDDFEVEKLFLNQDGDLNEWAVYVGKHHCEIFFRDGDCYIRPLKTTNPTYVLGLLRSTALSPFDEIKLTEGTVIAFGAEEFAFSVHMERTAAESKKGERVIEEVYEFGWFITCPNCQKRFRVENEDSRVEECDDCGEDISYIKASYERV